MTTNWFLNPRIFIKLSLLTIILITATEIEDQLETQIDAREPRGFRHFITHTLSVRQVGFKFLAQTLSDGNKRQVDIGNWELFATR